jgi:hypothetical protein
MFVDWSNQHCENGHITKGNIHVQHSPYQNSNDILHRNRNIKPGIYIYGKTKDLE